VREIDSIGLIFTEFCNFLYSEMSVFSVGLSASALSHPERTGHMREREREMERERVAPLEGETAKAFTDRMIAIGNR
jgi:hypothetical protein